ncbi:MAG: nitroreductase [Firmicutes bacterium]|nr:nitroreductase [Bacillota bacterium]
MECNQLIVSRRTITHFEDRPVPTAILQEMIAKAVWVPNHHVTQPWRFIVAGAHTIAQIARIQYQQVLHAHAGQEYAEQIAQNKQARLEAVPALIIVLQQLADNAKTREEDFAAVSAAIYAMTLVAWQHQVGTAWKTGDLLKSPELRRFLGVPEDQRIVAMLWTGYPAEISQKTRYNPEDLTQWLP